MCGIVAAFHFGKRKTEEVNHFIMNQYEDQYNRGQEGFGFIKIGKPKEQIEIYRATEPIKAMVDLYLNPTTMGIFHHRAPTASINDISQTHPMIVESDNLDFIYAVVHNGSIQNADAMYTKHTAEKFIYQTYYETHYPWKSDTRSEKAVGKFNDSEPLAIELAKFIEGKSEKIESYGNAAFIVLQCTKDWTPVAIHFGRNDGKPLNMELGSDELYLSSEGAGEPIKTGILYSSKINSKSLVVTEKPMLMAVAPPAIVSTYHHHGHNFNGYCRETKCHKERVKGLDKCAEHADVKDIQKKKGTTTDPRPICLKPNCRKVQRTEMNIRYCKMHKEMAKDDKANPLFDRQIGKNWDCKELGGEMCYDCQHENKTNKALTTTKTPMGFKTDAEREALNAEMKTNDEDPTEVEYSDIPDELGDGTTAQMMEAVIDEYFETLEEERLPDYNEYGTILEKLMEVEYERVEKRLQQAGEIPTMWRAEVGPKVQEAEMYLAYLEDSENDRTIKEINDRTIAERDERTIEEQIEAHQNANYF